MSCRSARPLPLPLPLLAALAALSLASVVAPAPLVAQGPPPGYGWLHEPMPEPMRFDLVRPLAARRGELEVNTLAYRPMVAGAPVAWAPEVEYAFADGHAIEFELPFEGSRLQTYKMALQGTIGAVDRPRRYQHGWQVIAEREREDGAVVGAAMYLAGWRLSPRVVVFTMTGLRSDHELDARALRPLQNTSVFYRLSPAVTLGVESNVVLAPALHRERVVLPQLHLALDGGYTLQMGVGAAEHAPGAWRPALGLRFVRQLH